MKIRFYQWRRTDITKKADIRKLRNVYLQLRKDLWFLSKSARPSTSVSNVLGNSFLKSKKAFYKQSYIANKILDLLISLSCREVLTLKYHAQTIFRARKMGKINLIFGQIVRNFVRNFVRRTNFWYPLGKVLFVSLLTYFE